MLKVATELDSLIEDIISEMLLKTGAEVGRWHFFVGSPGNGKSTATGEIVRWLLGQGCQLKADLPRGEINLAELKKGEIPYVIKVWEPEIKFETVWLAQDASVVRDPWSSALDPAEDLLHLLEEAWQKGVSLVVCANRGVIESAARSRNPRFKDKEWHSILGKIVEEDSNFLPCSIKTKKNTTRFKSISITSQSLDKQSLLIKTDTFARLIDVATKLENWSICEECASRKLCPFRANREWLSDPEGKQVFLNLLSGAEVLSGQIIVMREALALISTILAGCPRDYIDGIDNSCQWVHNKIKNQDVFALASRRIYMTVFSAHTPRGLEDSTAQRKRQIESLKALQERLGEKSGAKGELGHVVSNKLPNSFLSTELGIPHLLGAQGTFQRLDPLRSRLEESFFTKWHPCFFKTNDPLFSPLESAMKDSWTEMYKVVEDSPEDARSMMFWLVRWSSAFTIRFGGMLEKKSDLSKSLIKMTKCISGEDEEHKELLYRLGEQLPSLLGYRNKGDGFQIALNDHVILKGSWVSHELRPEVDWHDEPGRDEVDLGLRIIFGTQERGRLSNNTQLLPAEVFHWLNRRMEYGLLLECFPRHLLEAAEAFLVRIAAKSDYSLAADDVSLEIRDLDGNGYILRRRKYNKVKCEDTN